MFKNHYQDDVPDELLAADGLYPIFITIQVSIFQLAFLLYEEILDSAKGCIFIFDSWFSPKLWSRVPLSALQSIDLTRGISMCVCDVSRFRLMELKWIQRMNGDVTVWLGLQSLLREWVNYVVTRTGKRFQTYISSAEKGWLINFPDARWVCSNMSDDSAAPTEHFAMPLSPSPPLDVCGPGLCGGLWPLRTDRKPQETSWELSTGRHGLEQCAYECVSVDWASADATHASAVSSHWLIPLSQKPPTPTPTPVIQRFSAGCCDHARSAWLEGARAEAPVRMVATATSSLWHNRNTHTHTHLCMEAYSTSIDLSSRIPGNPGTPSSGETNSADSHRPARPPPPQKYTWTVTTQWFRLVKTSSLFTEFYLLLVLVNHSGRRSGGASDLCSSASVWL